MRGPGRQDGSGRGEVGTPGDANGHRSRLSTGPSAWLAASPPIAGKPHPQPGGLRGDDGSSSQVGSVGLDHAKRHVGLQERGHPDQAQDACVRQASDDGELAELLVERDEDARLGEGAGEDLDVARVDRPVA